jgi:hypothetical protein
MTIYLRKLSRERMANAQTPARQSFAAAAPTQLAAARASTTLALSMMVALRYLDGRSRLPAAAPVTAIPDPALS